MNLDPGTLAALIGVIVIAVKLIDKMFDFIVSKAKKGNGHSHSVEDALWKAATAMESVTGEVKRLIDAQRECQSISREGLRSLNARLDRIEHESRIKEAI